MTLQETIKKDLAGAMKAKDEEKKNTLRVVMGEFSRQDSKSLSDADVVKILKKLIKSEKETLERKGEASHNRFIDVIEGYLPKTASEDEIRQWIAANIDLASFKNKMQAMRPIMQHFGSSVDGDTVKNILQSL